MPKTIITINRQYGSGGREIGELVANKLSYLYYDTKLINRIAELGDIDADFVSTTGEGFMGRIASVFTHANESACSDEDSLPLNDRLFLLQGRTVKQVASEAPCVIIGHCADYFLADFENVLNVFIYADWDCRIARVMERNNLQREEAIGRIKKISRNRQSFYEAYTDKHWGRTASYDLSLSSSYFGINQAAETIATIAKGSL